MKYRHLFALSFVGFLGIAMPARACDLCAIYTADQLKGAAPEGYSLAVTEQFTGFNKLQDDGKHVENVGHQSMTSSVTQIVGRYDFSEQVGLQLNVPIISREYKRAEEGEIRTGSESGIGDWSLLALFTPYRSVTPDSFFRWGVRAGIKMPTGDSDRLREETEEGHEHGMDDAHDESEAEDHEHASRVPSASDVSHAGHHEESEIVSGVHGHDLALGSGSWDYVFGSNVGYDYGRFLSDANIQYIVRTEGDFDYRYQNDLVWELGAGGYLMLEDHRTMSLKANLSGEYKGMDVFDGNKATDTGVNSMFLGPELTFTESNQLMLQLGLDLPLFVDNTDLQIVPDYRFRVNVTYRF